MKAKRIFFSSLLTLALFSTGCSVKVANMTPMTLPTNPSGIYTLTAKADVSGQVIDQRTLAAYAVIDGEKKLMQRSDVGANLFDYDYVFPTGKTSADYYYIINYRMKGLNGEPGELREIVSPIYEIQLIQRYSITLDADRAPAGTKLAVLGRGFSMNDRVFVGGNETPTRYVSSNHLEFTVPSLVPGSYSVEIRNGPQVDLAGSIRIDPGTPISVLPQRIDLGVGQRQVIAFAMEHPAPEGGLYLDVTTSIPNAIIMPEVIIPANARTVNVTIEGAAPGSGMLFVKTQNSATLEVPVSVK